MQNRFDAWVKAQDSATLKGPVSVGAWLGTFALVFVIVAIGSLLPGTRDFFGLPFWPALVAFVPALTWGIIVSLLWRAGLMGGRVLAASLLVGSFALQGFTAFLVYAASPAGAAVFAGFLIFTASFHGHMARTGTKYPYGAFVTLGVVLTVAPFSPTDAHRAIFAIAGPAAIAGNLLLGTFALRADADRAQAAQLRSAVLASMLRDQAREVQRLSQALTEAVGYSHDVNNGLAVALVNAQLISDALAASPGEPLSTSELREAAEDIVGSLSRIRRVFAEAKRVGREVATAETALDVVEVAPVAARAVREAKRLHPNIDIVVDTSDAPLACAVVRGGEVTLHRVIENLARNACEGDGREGAHRVRVHVAREDSGHLALRVEDDGRGFSADALARPIAGFQTTKPAGTGLGLFTAERLVDASGGRLTRANRDGGGAVVTVHLLAGERS
jgi:signal transduction histidine kinase